jgi:hypothetical protein
MPQLFGRPIRFAAEILTVCACASISVVIVAAAVVLPAVDEHDNKSIGTAEAVKLAGKRRHLSPVVAATLIVELDNGQTIAIEIEDGVPLLVGFVGRDAEPWQLFRYLFLFVLNLIDE